MHPLHELERRWREAVAPPRDRGTIRAICVRTGQGVHVRAERVSLTVARGVEGDRWWEGDDPDPDCQVTLMSAVVAELIGAGVAPLEAAGDNFLVDLDLAEEALPVGTCLRLGTAVLEITAKPHTGCRKFRERFGSEALRWVNQERSRRLRGIHGRVVVAGEAAIGDVVEVRRVRGRD
jgi:MOSC domain-containing protein YiiM